MREELSFNISRLSADLGHNSRGFLVRPITANFILNYKRGAESICSQYATIGFSILVHSFVGRLAESPNTRRLSQDFFEKTFIQITNYSDHPSKHISYGNCHAIFFC